jgi:hypothetical protein
VRPVRTGGGGGRLRGRGSAVLSGAVSAAALGAEGEGRGGVLTVESGAMPGSVPSDVAPSGTAPAGTEGSSDGAL